MDANQMAKKIIFKDESSYSVERKKCYPNRVDTGVTSNIGGQSCDTCKHYFSKNFPINEPCKNCTRCSLWEAHIEEVKFTSDGVVQTSHLPVVKSRTSPGVKEDPVNHPAHYTNHPSGIECIQITEHMSFCVGNAMKYEWRAGLKGSKLDNSKKIEDLKKAQWYLNREISKLEKEIKSC